MINTLIKILKNLSLASKKLKTGPRDPFGPRPGRPGPGRPDPSPRLKKRSKLIKKRSKTLKKRSKTLFLTFLEGFQPCFLTKNGQKQGWDPSAEPKNAVFWVRGGVPEA